jgi:CRP-like cAMP-binding protein
MVSLVKPMSDGTMVEVGIVGREGFVGLALVLGGNSGGIQEMVQIAGSALMIPSRTLLEEVERCPTLAARLLRYGQALLIQVSQTAACNGRHTIQERLARWLLMARDRIDDDAVPLSHELLSMMLGARRAGITVALGIFRSAGLIANAQGKIKILDEKGLEAAACECYRVVREEVERLLP